MIRCSHSAMGSEFTFWLNGPNRQALLDTANEAFDLIDRLDAQLSHYRMDSELSYINARAAATPVKVEPRLFRLIETCMSYSRQTGGAFDITAFALVRLWGFHSGTARVPSTDEIRAAMDHTGFERVRLHPPTRSIVYERPGVEMTLAAVGKGVAVDRAADLLRQRGISSGMISAGGSSVAAIGAPDDADAWPVGIEHPTRRGETACTLRLRDAALSTSGTNEQFFERHGVHYGHILDPRTGWPVHGAQSVSVVAPTATEAEMASTSLFVMSASQREPFLTDRPGLSAIVIASGVNDVSITRIG